MHKKEIKQKIIVLFFLFTVAGIPSACAPAATKAPAPQAPVATEAAAPEPAATEAAAATEAPAVEEAMTGEAYSEETVEPEPMEPSLSNPVQYGQDSRAEFYQFSDPQLQTMASSVAVFVHKTQVSILGDTVKLEGYTLNEMSELGWLVKNANHPLCAGELFASQKAPGFCTGFLVEEDLLVTAGHCLEKYPCADTNIVFDFYMESENLLATITRENVFECKEVLSQITPTQDNGFLDYAIIKLDRSTNRAGLEYTTDDLTKAQEQVVVLGYPSGLPLKIASNAFVISNNRDNPFFIANLDTFGSNSGSPVINTETYQVEGILVRGTTDYVLSNEGACIQVNRCPESGSVHCEGENATKMSVVAEAISENTASDLESLICLTNLLLVIIFVLGIRTMTT